MTLDSCQAKDLLLHNIRALKAGVQREGWVPWWAEGEMGLMVGRGRDGSHGVLRRDVSHGVLGRNGSHDVQREGWVSWCAVGGMGLMVCSGRDGPHLRPPDLEATGRARDCSLSTDYVLPLDSPPAQVSLRFLSLHLCVEDCIQS